MQELTGLLTPFVYFITALFGTSTAGSLLVILSSCLFLTGFLRKTNPDLVTPNPVKESDQITPHISELQSQAKLGSEAKQRPTPYPHENVVFHMAQLQAEAQRQEEPPAGSGIIYERGRLTTIGEAARITGKKLGTIYNLLNDGKLTVRGRIIASARGGGKILIDLDELDSIPKKLGGRPRKIPERFTGKRPRGRPRKTPRAEGVEPKLITLKEAAETQGVGYETLRSWYRSGHLPERGREVFGTHGGGKILVDEQDVIRLKSQPPRRGKPPIKSK